MKVNKDFELFKKEFIKWQKMFGLSGYTTYFKHEPLEGGFAEICINLDGMVATVTLSNQLKDKDKPFKNIKQSAKHEALHLLIGRLSENAKYRHVTIGELGECTEELVNKLYELIN